jgi:hypothetical protein
MAHVTGVTRPGSVYVERCPRAKMVPDDGNLAPPASKARLW